MSGSEFLDLFAHFAIISMLSIGGALATSSEMHRYLVDERGWINHQQFVESITLAQAAPGPNVLFVTLLGWQVAGTAGALATTLGVLVPSSVLTFYANRWRAAHYTSRLVRAIRLGLSPVAIGMTAAAGWVIAANSDFNPKLLALTILTMSVVLRSKINPLWLIALGAGLGASGILSPA
jgi:chromate transporter